MASPQQQAADRGYAESWSGLQWGAKGLLCCRDDPRLLDAACPLGCFQPLFGNGPVERTQASGLLGAALRVR